MNERDWAQLGLYLGLLVLLTPPVGRFMARVFAGERTFLSPVCGPLERWTYRLAGCDPKVEMRWTQYAAALLAFNFFGFLVVLLLQLFQAHLPLNPQKLTNVAFPLALNTAVSFITNTNWQAYSGEVSLSYLVQMVGLTTQNFVSAATGSPSCWPSSADWLAGQRRRWAISGRTWCARRSMCCCLCRWCSRWCWSARGWCRPSLLTSAPFPWRAASCKYRSGRRPRRLRSNK